MLLKFLNITANLKNIPRQGWIDKLSIKKPESVADHIFSTALIGMVFSDIQKLNTEKILKIILIHDLAESITGDITPDQSKIKEKKILENTTMKKILNELPLTLQKQYSDLWKEYIENKSNEAKLVHQLDKLEMALQAKIYLSKGHSKEKLEPFFNSAKNAISDPKLLKLLKEIESDD